MAGSCFKRWKQLRTPITKPLRQPKSRNGTYFEVVLSCARSQLSVSQLVVVLVKFFKLCLRVINASASGQRGGRPKFNHGQTMGDKKKCIILGGASLSSLHYSLHRVSQHLVSRGATSIQEALGNPTSNSRESLPSPYHEME